MPVVATTQLTFSFEPSVRQRFPTLRQCLHYIVLQDPRGIKAVAADCDLSESELSRRLTKKEEGAPRSCDVDDVLVAVMRSTGSQMPMQWLHGEFSTDDRTKTTNALHLIETLVPQLLGAADQLRKTYSKR